MINKVLWLILSVLILVSCEGDTPIADSTKPRIPKPKPAIPQVELQANVLGGIGTRPRLDMEKLIETINQNISQPTISSEDIERGWYTGREEEKKVGTPDTWIWVNKGSKSIWASPSSLDETDDGDNENLCETTAGMYSFSCAERELPGCENIGKSVCRCSDETQWIEGQGCILVNSYGKLISVTSADLLRGWYLGLPNEKKLDTPPSWVWVENGQRSKWQVPNPLTSD